MTRLIVKAATVAFIALGTMALPERANASLLTYSFTGIWDTVSDSVSGGSAILAPTVGGALSGLVTIDTSQTSLCPVIGCYGDLGEMSQTTGGHTFSTGTNNLGVNSIPGNPGNWVANSPTNNGTIDGTAVDTSVGEYLYILVSLAGTKPDNSILPNVTDLILTDVQMQYGLVSNGVFTSQVSADGHLTSFQAVPLPTALPLFASGLAGLGWLSRRRRKTAAQAAH